MSETETVTQAVEKRDNGPMAVVGQSQGWIASIVPSHVDAAAFVALAKAHLRKDPKLAEAAAKNVSSYMMALSECARLGLVPGDTFHIVHFKNNRTNVPDFVGITDYTGEIELMYRAGAIASVKAEIVYSGDYFDYQPSMDRPTHRVDWFGEGGRGDMIGVYAYAVMKDGATSRVVVMSKAEVLRVKAVSKTASFKDSPWQVWEDRMWLKTAIHQLEKWVPTSSEYRREQLRAAVEADNLRRPPTLKVEAGEVEHADGEIVEPPNPDADAAAQAAEENNDWPAARKPGSGDGA